MHGMRKLIFTEAKPINVPQALMDFAPLNCSRRHYEERPQRINLSLRQRRYG
jgi:hypothetical protein